MSTFRTALLLVALATTASACTRQTDESAAGASLEPVKNLLLICIDTVRADIFYQLGELKQDRLNAWQKNGLVFTQAAAPAPWTVPSIASVFTGLWPQQHGAGSVPGLERVSVWETPPSVLPPDVRTLAQEAGDNGFSTTMVSASSWTYDNENPVDLSRGFEQFHDYLMDTDKSNWDIAYWEPMLEQWNRLIDNQQVDERALNFVHFMEAHNWHMASPKKLQALLSSISPEDIALYRTMAPAAACRNENSIVCRRYLVYVHAVGVLRDTIATMLDDLEEKGQLKDTAVIVFSDHGEEFHDHIGEKRLQVSSAGMVGLKFFGHGVSLYEEQLHVPLVVWHPGLSGAVIDTPVSLIDIAPSAASWLGLAFAPAGGEGQLLHAQATQPGKENNRVLFASHVAHAEKQMSARKGAEKAIWYMASDRINYFDLERDPDEQQPVAAGGEQVLAFDARFLEYEQMKQEAPSEIANFTEEQLESLQAIGYLQGVDSDEAGED